MQHAILSPDPSPLIQTAVYMGGILAGYLLLTRPDEWARVHQAVRTMLRRR